MRHRGALAAVSLFFAIGASGATSAQATTVTVGSPLTANFHSAAISESSTVANVALEEPGAFVASPVTGAIVRWRITAAVGTFQLRVLRPDGGGTYTGQGTSSAITPTGTETETFATTLPIQAGDLIGIDSSSASSQSLGYANLPGSSLSYWDPLVVDNGSGRGPNFSGPGVEVGFNADVQPTPGISSLSLSSGTVSGGTTLLVAGHDFGGATTVKFGATSASSFTVSSDSQISAVAPASAAPGQVAVTVTTPAGTATAPQQFTYTACVVPRLKGKKLKAAKKALKRADCKLGKVKGKKGKAAKVKSQRAKAGMVLPPGSKVGLKLATGV